MSAIDRIIQISELYNKTGCLPKKSSDSSLERTLYKFLYDMRNARIGKGTCKWKEEYIELAISHKLPADLFDDAKTTKGKKYLDELKSFVDSSNSLVLTKFRYYSWLLGIRNKIIKGTFNSILLDYALSIGLSEELFKSRKKSYREHLTIISNFYKKNGKLPSLDDEINSGCWLSEVRNRNIHITILDEIVIQATKVFNLPENMFEIV